MYKILIADDSVLDLECITFLIQKYALPLDVTTADDGQTALKLITRAEIPFDILFTDIRMPVLDGLALSKETRQLSPDTQIILYSGYNDFEYARTAITLGVKNYLLKPIVPDDFIKCMETLIAQLEQQKAAKDEQRRQEKLLHSRRLDKILRSASLSESASDLLNGYSYLLLVKSETELWEESASELEHCLADCFPWTFDCLYVNPTRIALFFHKEQPNGKSLSFHFHSRKFASEVQQAASFLNTHFQNQFLIAFSPLNIIFSANETYRQLEKLLENSFFTPERSVFSLEDEAPRYSSLPTLSLDLISSDLKTQNYLSLETHLNEFFSACQNASRTSLIYIKYCFTRLAGELLSYSSSDPEQLQNLTDKIYHSDNIHLLIQIITELTVSLKQNPTHHSAENQRAEKIKEYIHQNYASMLTLEELAQTFYLSPNYLCALFKKETGRNLTQYINQCRLKHAAELLKTSPMKISRVAETVGFRNVSYFCQKFRDCYGITPEQYRHTGGIQ